LLDENGNVIGINVEDRLNTKINMKLNLGLNLHLCINDALKVLNIQIKTDVN